MTAPIELLNGRMFVDPDDLLARSRAGERDVVVLSGTLLEGFGNPCSDLDLYVIGDHLPTKGPEEPTRLIVREDGRVRRVNETLADPADMLLDVQYYTFRELETLARSLDSLYSESRRGTSLFSRTLHHEDEDLIHKLLTGTVLQQGSPFEARARFDPARFCFLKYRNQVGSYAEFRDLVGSWTAGDFDTCLFNARSYLITQVSAMMFLAGHTNPRAKWFVRRLGSLNGTFTRLRDGVMHWLNAARRTDSQKRDAIESAFELIDLTYTHARELLGSSPLYYTAEEALQLTDREFAERTEKSRDMGAEWRMRRRMFCDSETSMVAQLRSQLRDPGVAAAPLAVSV